MTQRGMRLGGLFLGLWVALTGSARSELVPALLAPGASADYAEVASSPTIKLDGQITLEAWLYPTGWRSYSGREKHGLNFMYKGLLGSHIDYMFSLQANGYLCYGTTSGTIGILRPVVPLNAWTHVAVTVNESTGAVRFYVNGVDQGAWGAWGGSFNAFNCVRPSDHALYLGGFWQRGWGYNNDNFIGKVAEMRVWNVVRTPEEILASFQKTLKGNEAGLSADWDFRSLADKSGHGNTLILRGSAALAPGQGPDLETTGTITVGLTQPTNGQVFAQGAAIPLAATATATAGVSLVQFLWNGAPVATDVSAPYTGVYTALTAGAFSLSARATNNAGQSGVAPAITVRVRGPYGNAPWNAEAGGWIEAENFDHGGAGVAYLDQTLPNAGGAYRAAESVDIAADPAANNGHVVGWTPVGEWLEYTINVVTGGVYRFDARVAAVGAGGALAMSLDGTDLTGNLAVPNTGAWNAYQVVSRDSVVLPAGRHVVRILMTAVGASGNAAAFDAFRFVAAGAPPPPPPPPPVTQTPYPAGGAWPVPGVIECEDFDRGGQGVAINDSTAANLGGAYRPTDRVDIAVSPAAGNGHVVGWTDADEWLEYTVEALVSGTYTVDVRVAAAGAGGQCRVELDGVDKTGPIPIPSSGDWSTFQTLSRPDFVIPSGVHTVRLVMVANGFSGHVGAFDWLRFHAPVTPPPPPPPGDDQSAYPTGTPWSVVEPVQCEDFDRGGQGVAYNDSTPINEGRRYRLDENVDVARDELADNNHAVGWTRAGEWLEYTIQVPQAGTYDLEVRVAAVGVGGVFRIKKNNHDITGDWAIPDTGAWNAYRRLFNAGHYLPAGVHTIRVDMVANGASGFVGAFDYFRFTPATTGAVRVECEDFFDYTDSTTINEGRRYRATPVDIAYDPQAGNRHVVGWTRAGEMLDLGEWTVPATGLYTVRVRMAGVGAGGQFTLTLSPGEPTRTFIFDVPDTGAWNVYQTAFVQVDLTAGELAHLVLVMTRNGASGHVGALDYIEILEP